VITFENETFSLTCSMSITCLYLLLVWKVILGEKTPYSDKFYTHFLYINQTYCQKSILYSFAIFITEEGVFKGLDHKKGGGGTVHCTLLQICSTVTYKMLQPSANEIFHTYINIHSSVSIFLLFLSPNSLLYV
jgi:hypothetical protein